MAFANSYMITNRAKPFDTSYAGTVPLPGSDLSYFVAPGAYVSSGYVQVPLGNMSSGSTDFAPQLIADLKNNAVNNAAQLAIFIHGMGATFNGALSALAGFGTNLQKYGPCPGLVIGFSWPSYDGRDAVLFYASHYPPEKTHGTIRDNINGSIASFVTLIGLIPKLTAALSAVGVTLQVNIICHSEGNYMAMLGMAGAAGAGLRGTVNQVLLLAADINNAALQNIGFKEPWSGQGLGISECSKAVTVYSSRHDTVLWASYTVYGRYHNPDFKIRLGNSGPISFDNGALTDNVYGLDCSGVATADNLWELQNQQIMPASINTHDSYFHIPQILQDMTQTMANVPPGNIANRIPLPVPDGRAYAMQLVGSELAKAPSLSALVAQRFAGSAPAA